jgi:hypothetical protein
LARPNIDSREKRGMLGCGIRQVWNVFYAVL